MQAIIKISSAELTQALLDRIRAFIGKGNDYEIELHVRPSNEEFYKKFDASLEEARAGKIIHFTPEEPDAYTSSKLG